MDLIKALYSKDFYVNAVKNWKKKKIIIFSLMLLLIYGVVSALSLTTTLSKFKKDRDYSLFQLSQTHPIIMFINTLPKTWQVSKDKGIEIYDNRNNEVKLIDKSPILKINLNAKQPVDRTELGNTRIYITSDIIYYNNLENNRVETYFVNDMLDKLNDENMTINSVKAIINKNADGEFDNISLFSGDFAFQKVRISSMQKLINKILLIASMIIIPLIFSAFIGWKVLFCLLLTGLYLLFAKLIKRSIKFKEALLLSLLVQSWAVVLFIFAKIIGSWAFPIMFGYVLLAGFGCFVIVKFIAPKEVVVSDKQ